jgi:hypothetical protein
VLNERSDESFWLVNDPANAVSTKNSSSFSFRIS